MGKYTKTTGTSMNFDLVSGDKYTKTTGTSLNLEVVEAITQKFTETLVLSDTFSRKRDAFRTYTDSFTLMDAYIREIQKQLSDTFTVSDQATTTYINNIPLSETVILNDSLSRKHDAFRTLTDSLTFTDTVNRLFGRTLTDSFSINDPVTNDIDDFEDNDIQGWTGDTGSFEASTSTVIDGTYSGRLFTVDGESDTNKVVTAPSFTSTTDNLEISFESTGLGGDTTDSGFYIRLKNDNGNVIGELFHQAQFSGGNLIWKNGSDNNIGSWSTNTTYDYEFVFDFANDQLDIKRNNTKIATNLSMKNSSSLLGSLKIKIVDIEEDTFTAQGGEGFVDTIKTTNESQFLSTQIFVFLDFQENIVLNDNVAKALFRTVSETVTLADALKAVRAVTFTETTTLSDTVTKQIQSLRSETVTVSDTYTREATYNRTYTDTVVLSDDVSKFLQRSLQDTVRLLDTFGRESDYDRTYSDTVVLLDADIREIQKQIDETMTLADTYTDQTDYFRTYTDTVVLSDTVTEFLQRSLQETMVLNDDITKFLGRTVSDTLAFDDTYNRSADFFRTYTDNVKVSDNDLVVTVKKSLTDTVVLSDTISKLLKRTIEDSFTLDDTYILSTYILGDGMYEINITATSRNGLRLSKQARNPIRLTKKNFGTINFQYPDQS